jgi:hypothetical protein
MDSQFVPAWAFSAETSVVWVAIASGWAALLFGFAIWRYLVFRSRCLRAVAIEAAPPQAGAGSVLLRGHVETEDGGPAIRFVIEQHGTEVQNKSQWNHTWRETTRQVQVRAFQLRLPDETRILVVPDEHVKVVDELVTEAFGSSKRRRVSEVSAGEEIWVRGVLRREGRADGARSAYRGGEAQLVLRRSPLEPLDISSGSLTYKFARWRRFYRVAAILFGILFGITQLGFFGSYYAQCVFGSEEIATVTGTHTYVTRSKNSTTTHYVVEAKLADGTEVSDEVARSLYFDVNRGAIREVPFRVVPFAPWMHLLGVEPATSIARTFVALLLLLVATIVFMCVRVFHVPWYEQRRVVERRHGRLAEHAWDKQVPAHPDLYVPGARKKR